MGNSRETFVTAVTCMDGRVQGPVADFIKEKTGARFVDTITEPGAEGVIFEARRSDDRGELERLRNKILISGGMHNSRGLVVAGHEECAGNDISEAEKILQIVGTAVVLREMATEGKLSFPIYAALVTRSETGLDTWVAREVGLPEEIARPLPVL